MTKKGIMWKVTILIAAIVFVLVDRACSAKAEGISDPANGWTPPDWIDTIGMQTQEPTPAPSEAPAGEDPVLLRGHQPTKINFRQINATYLYQSSNSRYVIYAHASNNGDNTYYNYPPFSFDATQRLAGSLFTAGRLLPYSGHTTYTRSIQLDNESYVFCLDDFPFQGDLEPNDTLDYSFRSESSLQLYTDGYSQSVIDRWSLLGYDNIMSHFVVSFSVDVNVVDPNDSNSSVMHYITSDQTDWGTFSTGYTLHIKIPDFDPDLYRVYQITTYVCINPLGSGSELAQPVIQSFAADELTPVIPHYIFSDGGIWWSRVVTGSPVFQQSSMLSRLYQKLFIPDSDKLNEKFQLAAEEAELLGGDTAALVLNLRSMIYSLIEDSEGLIALEIDLPRFSIPINGVDYTLWDDYHFCFSQIEYPELFFEIMYPLRFILDTLIVTAFVNSIFGIVVCVFDLKMWRGVEGDDITE